MKFPAIWPSTLDTEHPTLKSQAATVAGMDQGMSSISMARVTRILLGRIKSKSRNLTHNIDGPRITRIRWLAKGVKRSGSLSSRRLR